MGRKMFLIVAATVLFAANCLRLDAAPITGSIDFAGVATFDTTSLATATRVDLWNSAFVLQSSGDFSSIAAGTSVTMATPWIFNPSTSTPSLWSVGNFHFDLTSAVIVQQTPTFLNISGVGTLFGTGFDPTAGTWSFTSTSSNGGTQSSFGFQASSSAVVPEPGTLSFLVLGGSASIGGVFLRRQRRSPKR
jgi:hypothetical protein